MAAVFLTGLLGASCTSKQEIKYRLVGEIDEDACVYVSTPARITPEGYDSVYTWIERPTAEGVVTVDTLEAERTEIGYLSKHRIPVVCHPAADVTELVLIPLEAARGITEQKVDLRLSTSPQMGLRLERISTDRKIFAYVVHPEDGTQLFEADPVCGWFVSKRGKLLSRVERPGSFVLLRGDSLYLVTLLGTGPDSVNLCFFKQPRTDAEILYWSFERYSTRLKYLLEDKARKH